MAVATGVALAASAAAGLAGGVMASQASRSAANTAADAQRDSANAALQGQREGMEYQKYLHQQTRADFEPYRKIGERAVSDYDRLMNGYDIQQSPAAKYQLTQGSKALGRSLASRGLSGSGNAAQRFADLNSSIAGSDWNNQYSRIMEALKLGTAASANTSAAGNALGGQIGAGAQNTSSIYSNMGNNLSNIYQQQGNNDASFWSGLGGLPARAAASGLSSYASSGGGIGSGGGMGNGWGQMPEFSVNPMFQPKY